MNTGGPPAPELDENSFPHPVRRLELVETHLSWVALTGEYAYKIKKPVRFGFIDTMTLEARRALCETELELNRRFAPDLYLDVVPLRRSAGRLQFGADGEIVDYAVRMRQFDRREELASLLERGEVSPDEIAALAVQLADFHARTAAVADPDCCGTPANIRRMILRNVEEFAAVCPAACAPRLARLRQWFAQRFAALEALMERRRVNGRVRDGHGDLHARNIVRWQGRLLPFDCLEFDAALRCGDVALDLAFLYMDLESKRRSDLAAVLIDGYCACGGDYEALVLLDFYAVHRALVRAKIDALQRAGAIAVERRPAAERGLAERLDVAERLAADRDPALVLMHGVSGSGKSWASAALVPSLPAVRVRSDVERRRIVGVPLAARTDSPLYGGAYAGEVSDRAYERLAACARHALLGGRHVVVDATFLEARRREPFLALAAELGCRLLIVSCHASEDELRRRVASRAVQGQDASEATLEVLERQLQQSLELLPAERPYRLGLDTGQLEPSAAARAIAAALPAALRPARER